MKSLAPKGPPIWLWASLGVVGVMGFALLLWATPEGVGLYYDSMPYLESAENLVSGSGLGRVTCASFKPLTRYPPLYSLLLAAFLTAGIHVAQGARLLSAACVAGVSGLVGASLWRATRSHLWALVGALWVLASVPVLKVFSWAMSEPVFVLLWLASLLSIAFVLSKDDPIPVAASALLSGLAFMARYAGAFLILSGSLLLGVAALRRLVRWRTFWVYLGVSTMLAAGWLIRGLVAEGNPVNRTLGFHLVKRGGLRQGADTILGWFGPSSALPSEEAVAASMALLGLVLAFLFIRVLRVRSLKAPLPGLVFVHVFACILYVLGVLAAISTLDPGTPLDDRILIPTYISLGVVLLSTLAHEVGSGSRFPAALAIALVIALGVRQGSQFMGVLGALRENGQGYAAHRWAESQVAHQLVDLRPGIIYTNDIAAVYFVSHLPSCAVPPNGDEEALTSMRSRLQEDGAVLAIFGRVSSEFMPIDRLTEGLVLLEGLADGQLYVKAPLSAH